MLRMSLKQKLWNEIMFAWSKLHQSKMLISFGVLALRSWDQWERQRLWKDYNNSKKRDNGYVVFKNHRNNYWVKYGRLKRWKHNWILWWKNKKVLYIQPLEINSKCWLDCIWERCFFIFFEHYSVTFIKFAKYIMLIFRVLQFFLKNVVRI
jgi:hypothetical protein